MKSQQLSLVITVVVSVVLILDYFLTIPGLSGLSGNAQNWGVIIATCALGLAAVNLLRIHIRRITLRRGEWWNSIALVLFLLYQAIVGIVAGTNCTAYDFGFKYILTPLGATMYAMLAFWIASAAVRAFRARSLESTVLLVSAALVMLGNAPIGEGIWSKFPVIKTWIMDYPNTAAMRGIMIGAAIGAIALGVRVMMGLERGHLGGE